MLDCNQIPKQSVRVSDYSDSNNSNDVDYNDDTQCYAYRHMYKHFIFYTCVDNIYINMLPHSPLVFRSFQTCINVKFDEMYTWLLLRRSPIHIYTDAQAHTVCFLLLLLLLLLLFPDLSPVPIASTPEVEKWYVDVKQNRELYY